MSGSRSERLLALVDAIRAFGMNAERAHACIALHCHFLGANQLHHRAAPLGRPEQIDATDELTAGRANLTRVLSW